MNMGCLLTCLLSSKNVATSSTTGMDDILRLDAHCLSKALAEKQFTCEDVMRATLHRVEELNDHCRAIILLGDREDLMSKASRADIRRRESTFNPRDHWLCGIPIAIKDISNVKGIPTTFGGSPLFEDFTPARVSDLYVANLVQAGAIVIGKTNSPENGLGSHTFNSKWGTTINPFDPTRSAGGSSGGAAVAVSTSMLCIADGTDMMGSLRNPAGWNNIYSHRPTAGLIPGALPSKMNPLSYPISTPGPIARSPIDLAFLLETMAGGNNKDASTFRANGVTEEESIKGLRIGWLGDWGGNFPFEEGILPLCRQALDTMRNGGLAATVDDLSSNPPYPADKLWTSWNSIRFGMCSYNFLRGFGEERILGQQSKIKEELKWEILRGKKVTPEDLKQAEDIAGEYASCLDSLFEQYDVLALPSAQVWPFPKEWKWPSTINGRKMDTYHRWMEVAVPVSFGGLPCSTVPAGFGSNGLPMGIQLFGKRGDDIRLLRLAAAYHQLTDWPSKVSRSESRNGILAARI